MNLSTNELLISAIQNGIIDLNKVQLLVDNMEKQKILEQHKFKIWQSNNGRWYTNLPDNTRPEGRRKIAKSTKEKLENAIIEFYTEEKDDNIVTLDKIYKKWLLSKSLHTKSMTYIKRINADWNKYYAKDEIVNIPLQDLNHNYLDDWTHSKIKEYDFTKKQYYNMSIIIRQSLDYALKEKIIEENPFAEIKVSSKMFKKNLKKDDDTQVFLIDEKPKIENEAYADFEDGINGVIYSTPLGVPLTFQLGCRSGELSALKFSDIKDNYIHIQRQEIRDIDINKNGKIIDNGVKVVEYTKSSVGDRYVYLTKEAKTIINMIKKHNFKYGYSCDDYIFVHENKRIRSANLINRLNKYCRHIGISQKRMHSIRKTYISTLIDGGVNINEIRKQVGHSDERTTYKNYCYNRLSDVQTETLLDKVLGK